MGLRLVLAVREMESAALMQQAAMLIDGVRLLWVFVLHEMVDVGVEDLGGSLLVCFGCLERGW